MLEKSGETIVAGVGRILTKLAGDENFSDTFEFLSSFDEPLAAPKS